MSSIAVTNENYAPISLAPSHIMNDLADAEGYNTTGRMLLVLDTRALDRECFAQSIVARDIGMDVLAVGSIEEWKKKREQHPPLSAILLNIGGKTIRDSAVADGIRRLSAEFDAIPLIVLADTDDLNEIMMALECGAKGYIPSSVGIDVCIEAIRLALAGEYSCGRAAYSPCAKCLNSGTAVASPMDGCSLHARLKW